MINKNTHIKFLITFANRFVLIAELFVLFIQNRSTDSSITAIEYTFPEQV